MTDRAPKSLAHSLGEFFGHIIKGVKADPSRTVVRTNVEEETRQTEAGPVVLRRTVIEEIEGRPREAGGTAPRQNDQP